MIRSSLFLLLVFFLLALRCLAQPVIPEHGGVWVHDQANVMSPGGKSAVEAILKAERDSTTNQIAVLIIPSLEGQPIEEYSLKAAEQWKLGKKDTDNGVLLLISVQDKRVRIEVGQGNEGALTDALSSRINRNEIAPHLRQGDYDGGVRIGVLAIIQAIKGQYKNTDTPVLKRRGRSPWVTLIIIVVIIIAASRRRGGGGGMGGYWAAGSILGSGMGGGGSYGSGGGGDYGGGGSFGGGGSSDSW